MTRGRLVERRGDDFAADRALHLGHFLRALVDQEHDQRDVRVVCRDCVRDVLQHHRLAGFRRRHEQAALALADRRDDVDDPAGNVLLGLDIAFENHRLVGKERREVLEQDLRLRVFRGLEVDLVDLDEREIALAVLRRADLAFDRVAGMQVETADLRRRNVDVVGAGEVARIGRAKEAEAVGQDFQHAFAEDAFALLRLAFQQREDQVVLAHPVGALDFHRIGDVEQLGNVLGFEFGKVHGARGEACGYDGGRPSLAAMNDKGAGVGSCRHRKRTAAAPGNSTRHALRGPHNFAVRFCRTILPYYAPVSPARALIYPRDRTRSNNRLTADSGCCQG